MESSSLSSPLPRVCVTGGGGFIASWLVKLVLSRGYAVHATVRDPGDPKNAFLKQLDGAPENLRLFKADMLDYDTVAAAFAGCEGVFHVATPVPERKLVDPEKEMMAPAIEGTRNVLKACSATNVQKLIQVPSLGVVVLNPTWPQDKIKDESCWSDREFCRENKIWYVLAKIEAEEIALEYGGPDTMNNKFWPLVDVRDVADALLLLYNKAASSERYLCSLDQLDLKNLLQILKNMYPNYSYVDKMVDEDYRLEITSDKLKNLGWKPRKLEETLPDSIESYKEAGILQVSKPCRLPFLFHVSTAVE
uniref:Uncharacterized protein n=1 Tax=Avena sativa TaxID=4498 RepID=A0ACD6ABV3_AVESA